MELSTDNSEDPTAAGEQMPPTKHEKKTAFCKLLSQKLEEAQTSTDFLYTEESGDHQLLLKQGFLRTVPPRFDAYNRSQARHFRTAQDIPKHHQQQLEEVWEEHPDASLATAIRTVLGVPDLEKHDVPEDAANAVLDLLRRAGDAAEGPNRSKYIWGVPAKRPLAEAWLGIWTDFWRLRGPEYFRKLDRESAEKDVFLFSRACEALVEELKTLTETAELEAVGKIAQIALDVLEDKAKDSSPLVKARIDPTIEALRCSMGSQLPSLERGEEASCPSIAVANLTEDSVSKAKPILPEDRTVRETSPGFFTANQELRPEGEGAGILSTEEIQRDGNPRTQEEVSDADAFGASSANPSQRIRWPQGQREDAIQFFGGHPNPKHNRAFYELWKAQVPEKLRHPERGIMSYNTWRGIISHPENRD